MHIRGVCGPLDTGPCGDCRNARLRVRRDKYFISEYGGAIDDIKFRYAELIAVLRTKDDGPLFWAVKE